jgi:hypothetical protein
VTLEISAPRRSDKPVKNLQMKTENVDHFQEKRDESNVAKINVFRSVCTLQRLLETDIRRLRRYDS